MKHSHFATLSLFLLFACTPTPAPTPVVGSATAVVPAAPPATAAPAVTALPPGISPTITATSPATVAATLQIPTPPAATALPTLAMPEVILYNGVFLTMDRNQPKAQAMSVAGKRILAVGDNTVILGQKAPTTRVIDLQGKTITPGFIDSHTHRLTQRYKWGFTTLQQAVTEALSQGWTGMDELAIDQAQLQELIALDAQGRLRSRINVYLMVNSFEGNPLGNWFRAYRPGQQISPYLRIAGLKIFIDYDSGRKLLFQQDELNKLARQLQSEGWTIAMKAISIQSHELALNALEYALNGESNALHRHRIEHSIAASDAQVARMARLGIIVCIQPSLPGVISFDADTFRMRDENGAKNAYRWSDYQKSGIFLIASPLNPYPDVADHLSPTHISPTGLLYRSVTQIGVNRQQPLAWMMEKTLTVEQILPQLTINGAFATFSESERGSLTPGKYADLVILSGNPLTTSVAGLLEIRTVMTMVGGQVEYCAVGQEAFCPSSTTATQISVPTPTLTPIPVAPFTGTFQGPDPLDGSITTLSLVQTGNSLAGTFSDTFSANVAPPGFKGSGSGTVLSATTAQITFNLTRWDGRAANADFRLTLSNQNNTLALDCSAGCPIVLQRQR
ncbi:MAG: amidohydrolase family protein [Chloroflexota bacterium]|nr:amidohydrolase family protein [Chloroflexota bacterium]